MIKSVSWSSILFLAHNMRERDRVEVFNAINHDSPDMLARECLWVTAYGKTGVAFSGGRPVGVVGVVPLRGGVWEAWAFGTNEWSRGARDLTRFAVKQLKPFVLKHGGHRVQAKSRYDHHDAHRWLRWLGAKEEGLLRGFGRDRSDYIMFAWNGD